LRAAPALPLRRAASVVGDSPMDALAKMIHDRWGRLISYARVPSPPLLSRTPEPEPEREAEAPVRPLPPEDRDDAMDVDAAGKGGLQEGEEEEDDDFVVRQIDVYSSFSSVNDFVNCLIDARKELLQRPDRLNVSIVEGILPIMPGKMSHRRKKRQTPAW
ncbi:hypothetical protein EJB05_35423, partial [Eragrostis curvula]